MATLRCDDILLAMVTLIRGRHSQIAYVHVIMIPYDSCPRVPWILLTQHTVHSPTKWDAKTVCIAIVQEWISQTIGRLHTVKPTLIPMLMLFVLLNPFCWLFLECHRNSVFLFGIGTWRTSRCKGLNDFRKKCRWRITSRRKLLFFIVINLISRWLFSENRLWLWDFFQSRFWLWDIVFWKSILTLKKLKSFNLLLYLIFYGAFYQKIKT